MRDICLLSAVRTPIGRFGGALHRKTAVELARAAVTEAVARSGLQADRVDLLILGLARQAGCGPNPARQVAYGSGLQVPAYTLNQACASGLSSIAEAARHLSSGEARAVVAAGAESMSNVPYLLDKARFGQKMGHQTLIDAMYRDGLLCPLCDSIMGETVQHLADELSISREEQDEFALSSQQKCLAATQAGWFDAELCPLAELSTDEHPRGETTLESLAQLKPVFARGGTVTAGNSSGITDGASAVVMVRRETAESWGLKPLAYFRGCATVALEPRRMGLGPVGAVHKFLQRSGWKLDEIDQFEVNEAFAAQVLACLRELTIDPCKLNLKGGAIALGHPIGCSGNRLAVTLIHELRRRQQKKGLATLCVSGGMGICAGFEIE